MSVTLDKRCGRLEARRRRAFVESSIGLRTGSQPVLVRAVRQVSLVIASSVAGAAAIPDARADHGYFR